MPSTDTGTGGASGAGAGAAEARPAVAEVVAGIAEPTRKMVACEACRKQKVPTPRAITSATFHEC